MGSEMCIRDSTRIEHLKTQLLTRVPRRAQKPLAATRTDAAAAAADRLLANNPRLAPERAAAMTVSEGEGCPTCNGTGYKGRVALYEVLVISDGIKELILNGASAMEIKEQAVREGMNSLRMAGINKIEEGMTTIDEVVRTTAHD